MASVRRLLRLRSFMFALVLVAALFVANVIALPSFADQGNWSADLTIFAPYALLAMAATPAILSGGGGIDLSVSPLSGLIAIVLVEYLLGSSFGGPWLAVPILLLLGAAVGTVNGVLVAVLRYQPVIATLCALFVLSGLNLRLVAIPTAAPPNWTSWLAGDVGPFPAVLILILAPAAVWALLQRTPYHRTLLAVGASDAASYSAGVNVTAVRISAYALGGLFAAVAGLALVVLTETADPNVAGQYVLISLAAVALGGTPIGGGRGGLFGSILGAAMIYLVQNLLTSTHVSTLWLQAVYGAMLLGGAMLGARLTAAPRPAGAAA
jgi:ribose transport system permease protein